MKNIAKIIFALFLVIATACTYQEPTDGAASPAVPEEITVYLNGGQLEFDTPPIIVNDRVLVPMRVIFETLGADVIWRNETRTARAAQYYTDADTLYRETITIGIGSGAMTRSVDVINGGGIDRGGRETIELDAPADIYGDRTLVPLRAVAEAFDADVQWDNQTRSVTITAASRQILPPQRVTVRRFLEMALQPVGTTLYVYGGGWNEADTGAGDAAVTIGLSPAWAEFYRSQDASYDSSLYRYQIEKGLDCSGYLGWAVYNTLETENGRGGYVFYAKEFGDRLAAMGLGSVTPRGGVDGYLPGDIMFSSDDHHVWISLGQCPDGSVVLLHSSPPGVRVCGTAAPDGTHDSQALGIAERFMSEYCPDWYERYPDCYKGLSYLTNYSRFRWDGGTMGDPDGYAALTPDKILDDLAKM